MAIHSCKNINFIIAFHSFYYNPKCFQIMVIVLLLMLINSFYKDITMMEYCYIVIKAQQMFCFTVVIPMIIKNYKFCLVLFHLINYCSYSIVIDIDTSNNFTANSINFYYSLIPNYFKLLAFLIHFKFNYFSFINLKHLTNILTIPILIFIVTSFIIIIKRDILQK